MLSSACVPTSLSPLSSSLAPPFFSYCFCCVYLHMFHQISLLVSCPVHCTRVQQSYTRLQQTMLNTVLSQSAPLRKGAVVANILCHLTKKECLPHSLFPEWKNVFCKLIVPCSPNARWCVGNFYLHPCFNLMSHMVFLVFQVLPVANICQFQFFLQNVTWCHFCPQFSILFELLTISPISSITETF